MRQACYGLGTLAAAPDRRILRNPLPLLRLETKRADRHRRSTRLHLSRVFFRARCEPRATPSRHPHGGIQRGNDDVYPLANLGRKNGPSHFPYRRSPHHAGPGLGRGGGGGSASHTVIWLLDPLKKTTSHGSMGM